MTTPRMLALVTGALYLVTFATSIPALALKRSFLYDGGPLTHMHWAVMLEVVLALACLGTAVAFFPIGARFNPALAVGFVASRGLEAAAVLFGAITLLAIGSARTSGVSPTVDAALIALHDAAFLLGPGLLPAVNALLFGTLLVRARLVPRVIPMIGLIGAPLLLISAGATVLGLLDQVSPLAGLAALPIAVWEFSIGIWLIAKGVAPTAAPGESLEITMRRN